MRICRKRQIEGAAKNTLCVSVAAHRRVGGSDRAQEVRILQQLAVDRRGDTALRQQRLWSVARAVLRHEEAAPCSRGGGLCLDVAIKYLDSRLRLLRLEQGAAETFKRLGACGSHGKRCLILLLGGGEIVFIEGNGALAHGEPEAGGFKRRIEASIARTVLLGLLKEAHCSAEVGLLHAHIAHSCKSAGILRLACENGLEAKLSIIETLGVQGVVGLLLLCGARSLLSGEGGTMCRAGFGLVVQSLT